MPNVCAFSAHLADEIDPRPTDIKEEQTEEQLAQIKLDNKSLNNFVVGDNTTQGCQVQKKFKRPNLAISSCKKGQIFKIEKKSK